MGHYSGPTHPLLEELASWGYVVLAPRSCDKGCLQGCRSLEGDPPCFGRYYDQQLLVVDFARSPAAAAAGLPINTSLVAVAGHSMGGQATLFSAAYNATSHGIKAAALHHAYTHTYPAIPTIPHLVFTGTHDTTAPPVMASSIFNAAGAFATRGLVNKAGAKHDEPGGSDGGAACVERQQCLSRQQKAWGNFLDFVGSSTRTERPHMGVHIVRADKQPESS